MSQCDANGLARCLNLSGELKILNDYLKNFSILENVEVYIAENSEYCTDYFIAIDFYCLLESLKLISEIGFDIEKLLDSAGMISEVNLNIYTHFTEEHKVKIRLSVGAYQVSDSFKNSSGKLTEKEQNIIYKKMIDAIKTAFSGYL